MDDLISRQAAIDAMYNLCDRLSEPCCSYENPHIDAIVDELEQLPSAQPDYDLSGYSDRLWKAAYERGKAEAEPRWVSVEERLPEYGEPVLTWDGICYSVEKRIPCIRDDDGEPIYSDWWVSDDYVEEETEYYPNLRDGACIAWMPLPKPYERSEDEQIHQQC